MGIAACPLDQQENISGHQLAPPGYKALLWNALQWAPTNLMILRVMTDAPRCLHIQLFACFTIP